MNARKHGFESQARRLSARFGWKRVFHTAESCWITRRKAWVEHLDTQTNIYTDAAVRLLNRMDYVHAVASQLYHTHREEFDA
jgi:hypothetical protein